VGQHRARGGRRAGHRTARIGGLQAIEGGGASVELQGRVAGGAVSRQSHPAGLVEPAAQRVEGARRGGLPQQLGGREGVEVGERRRDAALPARGPQLGGLEGPKAWQEAFDPAVLEAAEVGRRHAAGRQGGEEAVLAVTVDDALGLGPVDAHEHVGLVGGRHPQQRVGDAAGQRPHGDGRGALPGGQGLAHHGHGGGGEVGGGGVEPRRQHVVEAVAMGGVGPGAHDRSVVGGRAAQSSKRAPAAGNRYRASARAAKWARVAGRSTFTISRGGWSSGRKKSS